MRIVEEFPHPVKEMRHVTIPMADGVRLAARIWLPVTAEKQPVPAILEYIPYRQRDLTAVRDSIHHPYFAGHGYAAVRVDLRGSGDSEGVLRDEYLPQEQSDGLEILRWIAAQPWCTGAVGMIGISWGGFNALQLAALQPPELKAIITLCSTDDRYADDVHYMGGCLLGDNLSWAAVMFAYNACPPDPLLVGDRWRAMWLERLEGNEPWLETWLRRQRRDDYWRHGSICEDYTAVTCPVLAASGWADGYSNAVFRLLANLSGPRLGLVGPWSHKYPHLGQPGPAIGFLQESLRWWDKWLKGIETGIMAEPMLRAWMQDSTLPATHYEARPGRWVAEPAWPSPRLQTHRYTLHPDRLAPAQEEAAPAESRQTIQSPLTVGLFAGKWCSYSEPPDLPADQRLEDGGSLTFETPPLARPLEILGAPVVELEAAVDRPAAMVAARLSDVAPGGQATRVTYGLLNLTHRHSHAQPQALQPGRRYRVRLPLNYVAYAFPADHRLRLSLSTSYWPLAWPPPAPVRLTVFTGVSAFTLPERPRRPDEAPVTFAEAAGAPPLAKTQLTAPRHGWDVRYDLVADAATLEVVKDGGLYRLDDIDLEIHKKARELYTVNSGQFDSPQGEVWSERRFKRGAWQVRTETYTHLTADPHNFYLHATLDAYEDSRRVFSRNWQRTIPRDHL